MAITGTSGPLPREAEVVIIGGGITGCATAYYLACRKVSVVLLERGEIAAEQSSRAWGFVRQQGRHPAEVPLAAEASRLWEGLAGELQADLEFVRNGILAPAESEADEARFRDAAKVAAEHGLGTRLLSGREVAALIPEMKGDWRAGLYTAEDGHAEPRKTTEAFAAAALRRGAKLFAKTGAKAVETTNGSANAVVTGRGTIRAGAVLCAAGLGTAALARSLGLSLPIHGLRVSVAETEPTRPLTKIAVWAPQVAFRPTQRNTFYVGGGYRGKVADVDVTLDAVRDFRMFLPRLKENRGLVDVRFGAAFLRSFVRGVNAEPTPEPEVNPKTVGYNMERFFDCFPQLRGLQVMRRWAGQIDVTPDMIPVIGPLPGVSNLMVAAGFSGHGFALGPASGKLLADLLTTGRPSVDLKPLRPSRFAEGDFQAFPQAF